MSQGILPRACFILVFSAFLSACGGGSSDLIGAAGDDSGTDVNTGTGAESFTITVGLDTNGDVTDAGESAINADTTGVLFATVLQSDGSPAVGVIVQFTLQSTVGEIFPSSGTALTDSTGVASVALTAGEVPGANTAVATVIDNAALLATATLTFTSQGDAGDDVTIVTLTFIDATPGNGSNIITVSDPAIISVDVVDGAGEKLSNRTVIITTTLGAVSVSGTTPAATVTGITDFEGVLLIDLSTGTILGAGTGTVSVAVGASTENVQFDIGVDGLQIGTCSGGAGTGDATDCSGTATFTPGTLEIGVAILSAGGTSSVSMVVVDANILPVPNIEILFSTTGTASADSQVSSPLSSNNSGVVTATYLATGHVGNDTITATESSAGLTASGIIEVRAASIGSIKFSSVTPPSIQIKGTGTSTANVVFEVLDVTSDPVQDATVSFELTTTVGGLSLVSPTGLTNTEGKATAVVNAGLIPTTVRVRATVIVDGNNDGDTNDPEDFPIETLSDGLSVNTGVPDQNSMSISASVLAIEGENFDGETTSITVRMSDAFNNPVPDGTTVQFRTEFGSIQPSCNTSAGACSVILTTTDPRRPTLPANTVQTLGGFDCPTNLIFDETVTITPSGSVADARLDYVPGIIFRVERASNSLALAVGADYTVVADGIDCVGGCGGETDLRITYTRLYLDEDFGVPFNNPANPDISNPGVATAPFVARSGIPCIANIRGTTTEASGYKGGLGQWLGGRSTVLAFAQGEESFIDTNGDGQYNFNEAFVDLPEAFHDLNEDGVFGNGDPTLDDSRNAANPRCYGPPAPLTPSLDPICFQNGGAEEEFIDFGDSDPTNNLKDLDFKFNAGNGIYNGTLCPDVINQRTDTCNNGVTSVTDPIADPCDEATEQYCTRDLVNIRQDIVILFAGSNPSFSVRDSSTGELISSVNLREMGDTVTAGMFKADRPVVDNSGVSIASGTEFSIGFGNTDVAPGVGEFAFLTSGSGGLRVDFADLFNGRMATGTNISVASDTDGCLVLGSGGGALTDSSALGGVGIFVSLGRPLASLGGGASTRATVTSVKGIVSGTAIFCSH